MSERNDDPTWEDPADPTEKRDWDVPSTVHGDPVPADPEVEGPPPHYGREQPADESEKRDWDVP